MNHRPSHGRTPPPSLRRGFTLLEVVFAAVLGAMVVASALALFGMMDRAKRLQNDRLETNTEMALAHKVLQQCFRTLLMDSAPEPKDDDMKDRIKKDIDEATDSSKAQERRDDAVAARFALQPDPSKHTADGYALQTIDLTLTTLPIHGVTRSLDAQMQEEEQLRQLALARQRKLSVWDSGSSRLDSASSRLGSSSSRLGSSSSSKLSGSDKSSGSLGSSNRERNPDGTTSRADRLRAAAAGLGSTNASEDRLSALADSEIDPPRAPGVRGTFEFRPEEDPKILARLSDSSQAGSVWALWWRQIPPDDDLDIPSNDTTGEGVNAERDRQDRLRLLQLARNSRSDMPEVKLLSGLTSAQWQVYRRRKMVGRMSAAFAKELPAYVNFKFQTVDGRQQDWLFEVAWSYGQEPGSVLAANDPLNNPVGDPNNPGGGDVAAAVQAAIDAANGGTPGSRPTGGNTGSVATGGGSGTRPTTTGTGGGGRPSGNPNVSGGNGRPIVITLPGGGTITIPANAQPGGGR